PRPGHLVAPAALRFHEGAAAGIAAPRGVDRRRDFVSARTGAAEGIDAPRQVERGGTCARSSRRGVGILSNQRRRFGWCGGTAARTRRRCGRRAARIRWATTADRTGAA